MVFYHSDVDTSILKGVVSVLLSMPTGDPSSFDDQLITIGDYAKQKPNNHIFHPEMKTKNDVITEILKGHSLYTALTEAVPAPLLYVQQF